MDIGFIILRHVTNQNKFILQKCYQCLRKFKPENKIVIIDDKRVIF